ncbi:MAG: hypothetical protein VX278_00970 [Myxococcota bacterium]|nr:hypothetical protein [Myxococcota bacterium]
MFSFIQSQMSLKRISFVDKSFAAFCKNTAMVLGLCSLGTISTNAFAGTCKIYRGSSGWDVAGRVDGSKIYRDSSGWDVAGRMDGKKIYRGSSGWDVAFRMDGKKIYRGSSGWDVAFRIDGKKIYRGSSGWDVAGRAENCSHSEMALAAMVL